MRKRDVIDLINLNDHLSPEYGTQLTNHLPMALYALHQIGASEEQIKQFSKDHIKARGIRPLKQKSKIVFTEANYQNYLGQHDYFFAHNKFFKRQIERDGRDETLKRHLNFLVSGVSGAAFHGLLRTAYGIMSDNEPEIIKGLAYWADTHKEITDQPPELSANGTSLKDLFEQAHNLHSKDHWNHVTAGAPNIYSKIERVVEQPAYQDLIVNSPLSTAVTLDDFRDVSLSLFQGHPNFTSLHCLTAVQGLSHLYNKAAQPADVCAHMGSALVAAYISIGAPEIDWADNATPMTPCELKGEWEKIRKSKNDHAIKLAFSAFEEYRETGKDAYLHIIKNIASPQKP